MRLISLATAAAAAVTIAAAALPHSAAAAGAFDRCYDRSGTAVAVRATYRVNAGQVAVAGRLRTTGQPIIAYNPDAMRRLHPITRIYVYYHECAHHVLGHSAGHRPPTLEADADCWAIAYMVRRGLLDRRGLRVIQRDIVHSRRDALHLPGPARASLLAGCYRSAGGVKVAMARPRTNPGAEDTGANEDYSTPVAFPGSRS
jgi:hypothetical protein